MIKRIKDGRSIIMSSQHLEEADELSDRLCIMTHGQLLALDTAENIKRQFGVGYKVLLEPRRDNANALSLDEFATLFETKIQPYMATFERNELQLNSDSTGKKIIYQLPFNQVGIMSDLLSGLEQRFGNQVLIDVEVNSLEDAYINIAKEEEKLLNEL